MKAVFLDRDGTIIVEPPRKRLTRAEDISLFPDTIEALKVLQDAGFALVVVTNQSGISEGLVDFKQFTALEKAVEAKLSAGGVPIRKVYVCPHRAADACECRKPKPKLLLDAAKELDIDLPAAFMVGDRQSDIQAGINAGTKTILVKTGEETVTVPEATYTATDLLDAARYIVAHG
ncbi:MAG TPA: HAD family hydrolase [Candidatus Saccharimonadales bacterium]|nr:HAD family hydrolase [Candidatus Saccharimonadales bacterium]